MFGRKNFADMHAWIEERLSDYIDNQLASSDRAQFDKHLSECSQCRASLESMKWTVSLLKQAPAVASTRSFVLPVPVKRQPTWAFGLASFAAAAATLLLFALVGIDLITQLGSGYAASAPAAAPFVAQEKSQPTRAASGVLQPTTVPATLPPAPTTAPKPMGAPASSSSSAASSSAAPASLAAAPALAPTVAPPMVDQTAVAQAATNAARDSAKTQEATPAPRSALTGSAAFDTATPSPTWTATPTRTPTLTVTPVPPTATLAPTFTAIPRPTTVARAETTATRASGTLPATPSEPFFSPLRLAEIGALFGAVFFGVLVVLLRRR